MTPNIGRVTTFIPTVSFSLSPESGDMNWYFQYTPGDMWDYDEVGTHMLIDGTSLISGAS
jgi:glucose dehydrogenase